MPLKSGAIFGSFESEVESVEIEIEEFADFKEPKYQTPPNIRAMIKTSKKGLVIFNN